MTAALQSQMAIQAESIHNTPRLKCEPESELEPETNFERQSEAQQSPILERHTQSLRASSSFFHDIPSHSTASHNIGKLSEQLEDIQTQRKETESRISRKLEELSERAHSMTKQHFQHCLQISSSQQPLNQCSRNFSYSALSPAPQPKNTVPAPDPAAWRPSRDKENR
jgi:hypothetical protein